MEVREERLETVERGVGIHFGVVVGRVGEVGADEGVASWFQDSSDLVGGDPGAGEILEDS